MKKILQNLFILMLCLSTKSIEAQVYNKFLNNSSWYESSNSGFGMPINYFYYNQSTDTIIKGLTYSKILVTGGTTFFSREDTIAKKVYMLTANDTAEFILYDFGMNIGDTVYGKLLGWGTGTEAKLILRTIDTVNTLAGPRRRFSLSDASTFNGYSSIEGIGCAI